MKKWGKVIVLLTVCVIGFVGGYFVNGWISNKNAKDVSGHTYEFSGIVEIVWEDGVTEEQKEAFLGGLTEEELKEQFELYESWIFKFEEDKSVGMSMIVMGEYHSAKLYYAQSLNYNEVYLFHDEEHSEKWDNYLEFINGRICIDALKSNDDTTRLEYAHVYLLFEKTA